jgi:hypothetical protein
LLDLKNLRAAGPVRLEADRLRERLGERDLGEVRERDDAVVTADVLDDPLRVLLAQRRLVRERPRRRLLRARALVHDRRGPAGRPVRGDDDVHEVAALDGEVGKVGRRIRPPFVPRCYSLSICNMIALKRKLRTIPRVVALVVHGVDTGLQDGSPARLSVDTDPSRCNVHGAVSTLGDGGVRDDEGGGDRVPSVLFARVSSGILQKLLA